MDILKRREVCLPGLDRRRHHILLVFKQSGPDLRGNRYLIYVLCLSYVLCFSVVPVISDFRLQIITATSDKKI